MEAGSLVGLPLGMCFPSHGPHSVAPIDLEHPHRQWDLNQNTPHPSKTVPDREKTRNNAHQLEDRDRNVQDGGSKGDEQEPEQPPPMPHHAYHPDGNHQQHSHQDQRGPDRVALRWSGVKHEQVRVDGRSGEIHYHCAKRCQHKKGHERPFQGTRGTYEVYVFCFHRLFPPSGRERQAVLPFDGLLFAGSQSDVDPRLYGQLPHPRTVAPDPLLDWWTMLMALVARETLTPLLGICGGAERLNVALGGTLHQHIEGHQADEIKANNWIRHTLYLDAEKLARCVRGAHLFASDDEMPTGADDHRIYCMHHQTPDVLAPAFTTWGWSDGIAEGFGYSGPMPWYALATMFHAEAGAACQEPLACSLFHSFLAAGRAYAASLRDALKSVRMRDRILRRLYAEALVQRLLHGPLPS